MPQQHSRRLETTLSGRCDCSKCPDNNRHNSCFDLTQFSKFSCQVLIFINLLFLLQFHPRYSYINHLANCVLIVYLRPIMFKLMVTLHAKIPKDLDFHGVSNFSGDMLIPLVNNFQSVLSAQAPMESFCNVMMSTFTFSLSQR